MILSLQTIARALGGEISGRRVLAPGPGHSPRDRSLAISLGDDAPDGFVLHSFANDDWRTCRDYVRQKLNLPDWEPGDGREAHRTIPRSHIDRWDFGAADNQANDRRRSEDDLVRIERAQNIWNEASDPRGTAAENYLQSRALDLPDRFAGHVLRFHPCTPWRNENTGQTERIPCLIAAFRSLDDDEITAIHRIRVDQPERWPKTERRMFGVVHGAAVKLGTPKVCITIGEGVETCMAAIQLGIQTDSAWALGSVGAISFFPVLDSFSQLAILEEAGEASKRSVRICARRWQRARRRVFRCCSKIGSDHNDALMAQRGR